MAGFDSLTLMFISSVISPCYFLLQEFETCFFNGTERESEW